MNRGLKVLALGLAAATALASSASAGGFGRGNADTDILFEDGNFNMRAGVVYVAPQRGFETLGGVAATDPDYVNDYAIATTAIKLNFTDRARCSGSYTEVYGGSVTYGPQKVLAEASNPLDGNPTFSVDLAVDELGLTCGLGFDAGPGRAWVLGGIFVEQFDYLEATGAGTLSFDGSHELGYRVGLVYEVPEIALRGQLLYRSGVEHNPTGMFVDSGAISGIPGAVFPTVGEGETPQSVELKFQSGVAAGTLVFGSVKWTDWSVIDTLDYDIITPIGVVASRNEYFWDDGWTVSVGVGRQFTDYVAGTLSLTWDQGVSTTEDMFTDTWTLGSGIRVKGDRGALSVGGAVTYLTSGSQAIANGASYDATVGSDWSFAIGGNFVLNF